MQKILLFFCGILYSLEGLAQAAPDRIYLLDQQVMQVWVDEIGENEILYYVQKEQPRQIQKIARSLVWKVVFANGDTELIQAISPSVSSSASTPAIEKSDYVYTKDKTVIEGKVVRVTGMEVVYVPLGQEGQRSYRLRDVVKIVYADGRTENYGPSEPPPPSSVSPGEDPATVERTRMPGTKSKKYLGLLAGGLATTFYRDAYYPFPKKVLLNWEAGLVGSLVSTRFYQARLELLYTQKGAVETFQSSRLTVQSENRLTYLQANVLPLLLKTGSSRFNFALGGGGYFAYLLHSSSRFAMGSGEFEDDPLTQNLFDVPTDYGLLALTGLYFGHKPILEVRYTQGLGPLMREVPIRMQGVHISLFLTF